MHHCQTPDGGLGSVEGLSPLSGAAGLGVACPASGVASGPPIREFAHARGLRRPLPRARPTRGSRATRSIAPSACRRGWNYSLFRDADALTEENRVEICWTIGGAVRGARRRPRVDRLPRRGHGAGHGRPHALGRLQSRPVRGRERLARDAAPARRRAGRPARPDAQRHAVGRPVRRRSARWRGRGASRSRRPIAGAASTARRSRSTAPRPSRRSSTPTAATAASRSRRRCRAGSPRPGRSRSTPRRCPTACTRCGCS